MCEKVLNRLGIKTLKKVKCNIRDREVRRGEVKNQILDVLLTRTKVVIPTQASSLGINFVKMAWWWSFQWKDSKGE